MDLIIHSLKSIAVAIIEPMHLVMLVVFGIIFYLKKVFECTWKCTDKTTKKHYNNLDMPSTYKI